MFANLKNGVTLSIREQLFNTLDEFIQPLNDYSRIKKLNLAWEEIKANNRAEWQSLVLTLCSTCIEENR